MARRSAGGWILFITCRVLGLMVVSAIAFALAFSNIEPFGVAVTRLILRQVMPKPEKYYRPPQQKSNVDDAFSSVDELLDAADSQMEVLQMEGIADFDVTNGEMLRRKVCEVMSAMTKIKNSHRRPHSTTSAPSYFNSMCEVAGADDSIQNMKKRRSLFYYYFHRPSVTKYGPHQWLWDSCFHVITTAQSNATAALLELTSLFAFYDEYKQRPTDSGSAGTGLLPEMTYWGADPNQHGVGGWLFGYSDAQRRFTDITQMPMISYAFNAVAEGIKRETKTADAVFRRLFAPLVSGSLLYWRRHRITQYTTTAANSASDEQLLLGSDSGLSSIVHPWESGLDASPLYDPMHGFCMHHAVPITAPNTANDQQSREDSEDAKSEDVCPPTQEAMYPEFVVLLYRYRHKYNWDLKRILLEKREEGQTRTRQVARAECKECFRVEDLGVNAVLLDNLWSVVDGAGGSFSDAESDGGDVVEEAGAAARKMTLQLFAFVAQSRQLLTARRKGRNESVDHHAKFPSRGFVPSLGGRPALLTSSTIQQLLLLLPLSNRRLLDYYLTPQTTSKSPDARDHDDHGDNAEKKTIERRGAMLQQYVKELLDMLRNPKEFGAAFGVPTTSIQEAPQFDPKDSALMWRGPTWPTTNWFVLESLRRLIALGGNAGSTTTSKRGKRIRGSSGYITSSLLEDGLAATKQVFCGWLRLHKRSGLHEYFNPLTGDPLGQKGLGMSLNIVSWIREARRHRSQATDGTSTTDDQLFWNALIECVEAVFSSGTLGKDDVRRVLLQQQENGGEEAAEEESHREL